MGRGNTSKNLKTYLTSNKLSDGENRDSASDALYTSKPIADLFTETTVLFADISGFTAWSSVREPAQVFTLLETVYRHFDEIAHRRRIFKVETVGDCYVAVAGLPGTKKAKVFLKWLRLSSLCNAIYLVVSLKHQIREKTMQSPWPAFLETV